MDKGQLLDLIVGQEREAIIRTLAMMAYNPAIGRVLERGGVERFSDLMMETIPKFYGLVTPDHFERIHAEACERLLSSFKTARNETLSYGQAQKPLNVFLKVYVDWAKRPEPPLAEKLIPLLHCPLDSLLMEFIKREFPEEYERFIGGLRRRQIEHIAGRLGQSPKTIARAMGDEFSLTAINKELYLAWQELLRSLYPVKPVMLDIIWVHERRRLRESASSGQAG
jgi:hypothetical protein